MGKNFKRYGIKAGVIVIWILVWQVISVAMNQPILLPKPIEVLKTFLSLIKEGAFVKPMLSSSYKIILGFLFAFLLGSILAALSYHFWIVKELLMPPMKIIKATPVASFVILALIWIGSAKLSILIAFLMVLPMVYTNLYQGLMSTDKSLLEMAQVFKVKGRKKIISIYIPAVLPYVETACSVGIGFCFKAGIAAEVIGIPRGSIGERLYESKLYLMTKELFAWTILIILISVCIEKLISALIRSIQKILF